MYAKILYRTSAGCIKKFSPFGQIISALQTPEDFPLKEEKEKRKGNWVFTNTVIL